MSEREAPPLRGGASLALSETTPQRSKNFLTVEAKDPTVRSMSNAKKTEDPIKTYLDSSEAAARVIFECARKARSRAVHYHRNNHEAARLASNAYSKGGFGGLLGLRRQLVEEDADGVIVAEVRRLVWNVESSLPESPPDAWR